MPIVDAQVTTGASEDDMKISPELNYFSSRAAIIFLARRMINVTNTQAHRQR
jgi:hypothetical protein